MEIADFLQFGGAMLGNFIVYLLGLLWSLVKHDSMPGFSEARYELSRVQKKLLAAFDKHLTRRNQQHFQSAARQQQVTARLEESQCTQLEGYRKAREQFLLIKDRDGQVVALLREYKTRLISQIKAKKAIHWFHVDDVRIAEMTSTIKLSPDQYAAVPLELRYA